jgi:hypothetical protein
MEHRGISHEELLCVRFKEVINPAGEQRRFHSPHPRLWKAFNPFQEGGSGRGNCSLADGDTTYRFDAVDDDFFVKIESDVVQFSLLQQLLTYAFKQVSTLYIGQVRAVNRAVQSTNVWWSSRPVSP